LFFPFEYSGLSFTVGAFSSASASHVMCINNMAVRRYCHALCGAFGCYIVRLSHFRSFLESHVVTTCDEIITKTCMFGSECDVYVAKHKSGYNDYLL